MRDSNDLLSANSDIELDAVMPLLVNMIDQVRQVDHLPPGPVRDAAALLARDLDQRVACWPPPFGALRDDYPCAEAWASRELCALLELLDDDAITSVLSLYSDACKSAFDHRTRGPLPLFSHAQALLRLEALLMTREVLLAALARRCAIPLRVVR